jgi:hypothetical protein
MRPAHAGPGSLQGLRCRIKAVAADPTVHKLSAQTPPKIRPKPKIDGYFISEETGSPGFVLKRG